MLAGLLVALAGCGTPPKKDLRRRMEAVLQELPASPEEAEFERLKL